VKLAGQWFAPHYATPESWTCCAETALLNTPRPTAYSLDTITPGERFAVLEISGDHAWGYRERDSRVGYVAADALSRSPQ
jgi:hypothetical protein